MRSRGALAALAAAMMLVAVSGASTSQKSIYLGEEALASVEDDESDDEESDSAPFMVVVEHEGSEWRCAGALVSSQTVLTTLWCAQGPDEPPRALWVVAAAAASGQAVRAEGARRVAAISSAGGATTRGGRWGGALQDVALLELEAPFGISAGARPILMALGPDDCAPTATCHVVQSLMDRFRLRIADAMLVPEKVCAPMVKYWPAAKAKALCVKGAELCARDWGGGVVCGGKLCGVVSRELRSGSEAGAGGAALAADVCGTVYVAQSVPRWRRFLKCAHNLRACGRGKCAEVCTERRLLSGVQSTSTSRRRIEKVKAKASPLRTSPTAAAAMAATALAPLSVSLTQPPPTATPYPLGLRSSPLHALARGPLSSAGMQHTYEPYRADFRGGEYEENALEYDSDDELVNTTKSTQSLNTTTSTSTSASTTTKPMTTSTTFTTTDSDSPSPATDADDDVTMRRAATRPPRTTTRPYNHSKSLRKMDMQPAVMRSKGEPMAHNKSPLALFIFCIVFFL